MTKHYPISLYNTLGKTIEQFTPLSPNRVTVYHCGPTVYWTQHIGNMRAAYFGDIVNRSLLFAGYEVVFVRNYTDVGHLSGDNEGDADVGEDRMSKAASRESLSPEEIARKYQAVFDQDLEALNVITPTFRPRATEYIDAMINFTQRLLDAGCAYQTELAIYFDTSCAQDYTKLSGQILEEQKQGHGSGEVQDKEKRNREDFALWFFKRGAHAEALQTWSNPFDKEEGFPGWHIECSAMIQELLGETIDIHIGGIEHIPIHHTNEIAQSQCANKAPLARFWLHNEHLDVDGHKMSKSGGTSYSIADLEARGFSALDLRYFFLQAHYRSKQNFTWEALEASQTARKRLHSRLSSLADGGVVDKDFNKQFSQVLYDDFNTAGALAVVYELLGSDIKDEDKKATIVHFDEVLGLNLDSPIDSPQNEVPKEVLTLLEQRKLARADSDWELSDKLRDHIAELGYLVKDTSEGQKLAAK